MRKVSRPVSASPDAFIFLSQKRKERYEKAEEACGALYEAISQIEEAISNIETAAE